MSIPERRAMVERPAENLSVRRQCALLNLARSGVYRPGPVTGADDLALMQRIDELHLKWPFYGSRRMVFELNQAGHGVNRKRVQRLMRVMGIEALVPRPGTSKAAPGHRIYPYLLRGVSITEPNHVWASDITYIPMALGFLYLVAIIDWASRAVLAWRLSNTMDAGFCIAALDEALARHGTPKYLTPIRARSSPAPPSPAGSRPQASRFRWTAAVVSWTTFSSSDCGARSNTRKCI
jgi:putative transposase